MSSKQLTFFMAYYKFIAKLSHSSFSLMQKVQNFSHAVLTGFWLGVMGEKSLGYSDELFYNKTKHYTDDSYNLKGLFDWEKPYIEKYFSNAKKILLIAAGGGREALALSKMGFEVDSFECNTIYLNYGNSLLQKYNIKNRIKYLPRNTIPGEIKKYDGIIIGWGAYSHITGSKRRIAFLSDLLPFMHEDSRLMISFVWSSARNRKDKVIRIVSDLFGIFSNGNKFEDGDRLVPDFIHFFTKEEIINELAEAKYKMIDYSNDDYGIAIAGI